MTSVCPAEPVCCFNAWVLKLTTFSILFQSDLILRCSYQHSLPLTWTSSFCLVSIYCMFVWYMAFTCEYSFFQMNSKLTSLWWKLQHFKGHIICCAFQNPQIGKIQSNLILDAVVPVRHDVTQCNLNDITYCDISDRPI